MTSISQHCATCRCQELMAKQDVTGRTWEKYDPAIDKRVPRSTEHAYWGHGDCATWIRVPGQFHAEHGGLPREVPRFATLEEAEAWLEANS